MSRLGGPVNSYGPVRTTYGIGDVGIASADNVSIAFFEVLKWVSGLFRLYMVIEVL